MSIKRYTYLIFIVLVTSSMILTACGGVKATEAPKKVVTIIWTQEFDTLNPLYSNMWFSEVTQSLWLAWAWNFDDNNNAVPYLVKEMPTQENGGISADEKTITLKLREDVKWSDGEALTAEDFIFTYQMAIDKNNAVASAYPYDQVASMDAPDDYTVVMNFEEPFAPWVATFWKGILPAHVLKPVYDAEGSINEAEWNLNPTVGCGPYKLEAWESGSFARFVVNENYWGTKPKIDELFFRFVPDDASQVAALQAGDGDLGAFISYADVPTLKEAGLELRAVRSGYNEGIFFVINQDLQPALYDVVVRKAIAMSIDREAIARDLLLGLTGIANSYWDALPYYNTPPVGSYPYDPEAAKTMLDEAGWVDSNGDGSRDKDGVELVVSYGTTIRETRQDAQAVIQQQLGKVGIKVDLLSFDGDVFFSSYDQDGPAARGEIGMMEWSDCSNFPDPDYYYWFCSEIPTDDYPAGSNWQFYCNEELDGLFSLQAKQVNPVERQKTFQRINEIFYEEVIWLGLWQDPDIWGIGPRLQNVKISGVTPFYSIVEWDIK
jgi:peptide/nickel transport system substrate-binding protein